MRFAWEIAKANLAGDRPDMLPAELRRPVLTLFQPRRPFKPPLEGGFSFPTSDHLKSHDILI
jgi:hypothetical protein